MNLICIGMPMGKEIQTGGFYREGCYVDEIIFQRMPFNSILDFFPQFKNFVPIFFSLKL